MLDGRFYPHLKSIHCHCVGIAEDTYTETGIRVTSVHLPCKDKRY